MRLLTGDWIWARQGILLTGRPASAKAGWPAPLVKRLAGRTFRSLIAASQSSSPLLRSPAATADTAKCSARSQRSICSFSTTGDLPSWMMTNAAISLRSPKNATNDGLRSSPTRCRSTNGAKLSANRASHDATFLDRLVRNKRCCNWPICSIVRSICQGCPLAICRPLSRPLAR